MTMTDKPSDFGLYLQLKRRAKGLSLEAVSEKTKIPVSRLQQLENQDLQQLPANVFTKGFIKAYALTVGADVQDALQRFDTYWSMQTTSQPTATTPERAPSRVWLKIVLCFAILLAMIAVSLFVADRMMKPSITGKPPLAGEMSPTDTPSTSAAPGTRQPAATTPSKPDIDAREKTATGVDTTPGAAVTAGETETTAPSTQVIPPVVQEPAVESPGLSEELAANAMETSKEGSADTSPPETVPPAQPSLSPKYALQISAIEMTWLKITIDDDEPKEITLRPNEAVTLRAQKYFRLLIGNAGGISLKLNDQEIGVPGKTGQVLNLKLP